MPLYDYRCTQCGNVYEIRHGFHEAPDAPCEACGGALTRVFNAAGIVFKGSGFYKTDSRKAPASESSSSTSSEATTSSSETKSESKSTPETKSSDSAA